MNISDRNTHKILTAVVPHLVLPLVRKRILTEEHLKDPSLAWDLVCKNIRKATREMQWCVGIQESFLDESVRFWRRDERLIAVVLYATAVEQYLNQMYQAALMAQGWMKSHVTQLLREVGTDAKVGWMFDAFLKRRFPFQLAQRLRSTFSVRNAIVHFKGEVGHPDRHDDSYSKIRTQLRGMRRMSISRDFRLLDKAFMTALLNIDPDRELVFRLSDAINKIRAARH